MSTYLKNKGGAGGTFHEVDTGRMFKVNEHQQDKVKEKPCVISCINRDSQQITPIASLIMCFQSHMPIVTSQHTAAIEVASMVVLEDKNAGSIHLQFYLRLCEQQKSDLTKDLQAWIV